MPFATSDYRLRRAPLSASSVDPMSVLREMAR
jgi:hypothetical protein